MKSYSYSAFKDHDNCPRQMFLVRIDRSAPRKYDSSGPGRAFHKVIDQAVRRGEQRLPSQFKEHQWVLSRIKQIEQKMIAMIPTGVTTTGSELGISVTNEWQAGEMFQAGAWYCGQLDFVMERGNVAYLTDWKFGNSAYADVTQLYEQACLLMHARPGINEVRADLTFVKDKIMVPSRPLSILRSSLDDLRADIAQRAERIYNDSVRANTMLANGQIANAYEAWEATPNGLCKKFCPVNYSRCEHSGLNDDGTRDE